MIFHLKQQIFCVFGYFIKHHKNIMEQRIFMYQKSSSEKVQRTYFFENKLQFLKIA